MLLVLAAAEYASLSAPARGERVVSKPLTCVSNQLTLHRDQDVGAGRIVGEGRTAKIDAKMHKRILVRLDHLNAATAPEQMNLPGFDFHALKGFVPARYTVHVNGPWCITFAFDSGKLCESISSNTTEAMP